MVHMSRRKLLQHAMPVTLAGWALNCNLLAGRPAGTPAEESRADEGVTAPEDLMREHGVIRRSFLIYDALAARLESGENIPVNQLRVTAELFRHFGEQYHEHSEE